MVPSTTYHWIADTSKGIVCMVGCPSINSHYTVPFVSLSEAMHKGYRWCNCEKALAFIQQYSDEVYQFFKNDFSIKAPTDTIDFFSRRTVDDFELDNFSGEVFGMRWLDFKAYSISNNYARKAHVSFDWKAFKTTKKSGLINTTSLYFQKIHTTLGDMVCIATDRELVILGFADSLVTATNVEKLCTAYTCLELSNSIIQKVEQQLHEYFDGKRKDFDIPLQVYGTTFQKDVWKSLINIPYGMTNSYKEQAIMMDKIKSVRAIANANAKNPMCIILPCHRVLGSNGSLTGYSGGLWRKQFLLDLEQKNI